VLLAAQPSAIVTAGGAGAFGATAKLAPPASFDGGASFGATPQPQLMANVRSRPQPQLLKACR
jgi:hypothetical protein